MGHRFAFKELHQALSKTLEDSNPFDGQTIYYHGKMVVKDGIVLDKKWAQEKLAILKKKKRRKR